jgi:phage terminase large subunit
MGRRCSRLKYCGNVPALEIEHAPVFDPLLDPARYKGAHGGRGSGKSQFFADLMVATAVRKPGFRGLCCREVQKSLKESAKRLIESKIQAHGLGQLFEVQEAQIKTPGGGVIVFAGLQDHTSESIKSYEGFDVAWVEEAQTVSDRSLNLLRPTIRAPGSELWFSWNPRRQNDAVDAMLRGDELPTGAKVVRANWNDNPWFPAELEQERQDCLRQQPDQYDHIWEGGYVTVSEGAYFASALATARLEKRITELPVNPTLGFRAYWDIGVRDATSIWIVQFNGHKVHCLDYYEAVGQDLATHLNWLRSKGYESAECVLPHDGAKADAFTAIRFEDHIRSAGFRVRTVPNQGRGAAMKRVETARKMFPSIWFDEAKCEGGLAALGWYHEKRDEHRNIGLGPEHDWSSHGADAFGLMCCDYEEPRAARKPAVNQYRGSGGWMR